MPFSPLSLRRVVVENPPDAPVGAPPAPDPAAPPPPAGAPPPGGYQERGDGKVQILSSTAYRKIKDEAREKGVRATQAEINAKVKALGFENLEEALAYAGMGRVQNGGRGNGNGNRQPQPQPRHEPPPPSNAAPPGPAPREPSRRERQDDPKALEKYQRAMAQWEQKRTVYQQTIDHEKKRRRRAERDNDELRTRIELERIANAAGIKRTKWAVDMLQEHLSSFGGDEAKLRAFDEKTYFEGLRSTEPWLFNEVVKPANTGVQPGGNGAPPPPAPGPIVRATGDGRNGFDARAAKPDDVAAQLRSLGINPMGP